MDGRDTTSRRILMLRWTVFNGIAPLLSLDVHELPAGQAPMRSPQLDCDPSYDPIPRNIPFAFSLLQRILIVNDKKICRRKMLRKDGIPNRADARTIARSPQR